MINQQLEAEEQEVFRGHFDECFQHFAARLLSKFPRGSKQAHASKQPIATFCGVDVTTVTDWMYLPGDCRARGESRLKLMFYLEMSGYRVIELERMPKARKNFAELIAFGVISVHDAATTVGYCKISSLYDAISGKTGMCSEKEAKIWDIWKQRKEEVLPAKEQAKKLYGVDLSVATTSFPETTGAVPSKFRAEISVMEGLLAMLEGDSFQNLSDADLGALRQLGNGLILKLSAQLSILASRILITDDREREVLHGGRRSV